VDLHYQISKTGNEAESVEKSRLYKHVAARGKRAIRDGDLSETDDSEESGPDSPALSNLQAGTARTRNMRGAATAAQQRMANIGRSETPESMLHHHETRTSARRFGGNAREDSPEVILPATLIVKLKVGKEQLKNLAAGIRPQISRQTSVQNKPQSSLGTPIPGAMGPPSTPGTQSQPLPPPATPVPAGQIGRLDAPPVLPPGGAVSS
jgi:SWI/SNF-related matrix-associated actin-dependent regulator of chromatin subfamily B protein 1